jgi:hypothetical protein
LAVVCTVEMEPPRRRRLLAAGLLVVAAACARPDPDLPAPVATPDATPERVRRALAALPRGWSELPRPPAGATRGVAVWTGRDLFVWGRQPAGVPGARAAAWLFDPLARRWRPAAATVLPARSRPAAAWTGREVLVWGGDADGGPFGDGAGYDPALDTWRGLPPAPLALNQATSAWTGRELLIVGAWLDGNNWSRTEQAVGLGYDPAADRWRRLPPVDLSPQASAVAWTGRELLAWDYALRAAAYDPARGRWRRLPGLPLDEAECYPQTAAAGRVVFAQFCAAHALWDQRTRRWRRVGHDLDVSGGVVAAGPVFLLAGPVFDRAGPGPSRLLAYNPG